MEIYSLEELVWSDSEEEDMSEEDLQTRRDKWAIYVTKYPGNSYNI